MNNPNLLKDKNYKKTTFLNRPNLETDQINWPNLWSNQIYEETQVQNRPILWTGHIYEQIHFVKIPYLWTEKFMNLPSFGNISKWALYCLNCKREYHIIILVLRSYQGFIGKQFGRILYRTRAKVGCTFYQHFRSKYQ